ncbi:hypothetical protein ACF0H5_007471 [Mactra antiquata]
MSVASPVGTPGRHGNLPVIEHPMSRLGDRNGLAIRGSATHGAGSRRLQRSNTDVGVRTPRKDLAINTTGKKDSPDRILNWPPGMLRDVTIIWCNDHKLPKINNYERFPRRFNENINFSPRAVDITPPFIYKEKPFEGLLPEIHPSCPDTAHIPSKVDKFPTVGAIPKLPPLPSIEEQEEFLKGPGKPFIKSKEYNYQPRTTQELIELVREKFGTGYYGIRHLFKANDPTGKGSVSREALQRILYTLCGYITPDQYTKLLRAMHLEGKTPIAFETFVNYFKETEDKKNWVSALQTSSMTSSVSSYPETYLRRNDLRVHDPYTSMPFSDAIFKEKCKSKNFDAHKVFPESCFEIGGLILAPQLREAYATLGIYMTDEDFNKLWQRYDKEGTGALQTTHFFKLCGLDPHGKPRQAAPYTPRGAAYGKSRQRPHSEIGHTNGMDTSTELHKILKKNGGEDVSIPMVNVNKESTDSKKVEITVPTATEEKEKETKGEDKTGEKKIEIKKPQKTTPKLENIIDCLHFKFEESYQAMLTAFQLFDFLNDSYVSKIDFRRVLLEFGFNISPSEFDHFLKKCAIRSIKGQLNYREFLNKYQSKSLNSLMARIATDTSHAFHGDVPSPTAELSAETIESRLIDHFHGDFIKLIAHFRQCDKYNIGVITKHEFKSGIERRLGYTMTETQWNQLKLDIGEDKDGLIPYTRFLELFDIPPGSWNVKQEGNIQVVQVGVNDLPVPSQVEKLKEKTKTEVPVTPLPMPSDDPNPMRSVQEIRSGLDNLFRNRFHTFDKHFKAMDRKMTGRMSKWQFGALIKMCGFALHPKEVDKIWATFNISTDGMFSYATLIQHFINYTIPAEQKETVIFEDTTELVETARRIQRERRQEQMQRDHLARMKAREQNEEWVPATVDPFPQPSTTPRTLTASTAISRVSFPGTPASRASVDSLQSVRTKSLLVKIRSDVINNWDGLKSVFKYIDRNGCASIPMSEMKDIMASMQFGLDEEEKAELCKRFDTQKNGRFNYLQFMKCYAQRQNKGQKVGQVHQKFSQQLQTQATVKFETRPQSSKKSIQKAGPRT